MTTTSPRTAPPLLGLLLFWTLATEVAGQDAPVAVSLRANEALSAGTQSDGSVLYFEPYDPPYSSMSCQDSEELGYVCSGVTSLDLSASSSIVFAFDASDDGSKFVVVSGKSRTRAEFRAAAPNCEAPFQEMGGEELDVFAEFESVPGEADVWETIEYNAAESFLTMGTEDGSDECEIFLRLQFEPKGEDAVMQLAFRSFSIFASYDSGAVVSGPRDYKWGTDGYMWIRRPEEDGEIKVLDYKPELAEEDKALDDGETNDPSYTPVPTYDPTGSHKPSPSTYEPTVEGEPVEFEFTPYPTTPPPTGRLGVMPVFFVENLDDEIDDDDLNFVYVPSPPPTRWPGVVMPVFVAATPNSTNGDDDDDISFVCDIPTEGCTNGMFNRARCECEVSESSAKSPIPTTSHVD